ncbi:aryl-sulfate sulfotransferase [Lignipirellula cremea]|uniref:Arylsulfotransferase (ASST) n=1 Tax=Lignipirellula cremea TaxID=2528010 RepID=A0A518DRM4_9BACT|nr:aryl-sulfate sulfotransferase [Lignipirellula cremea]QDU94495.1 Arylsulfotransferase (ASST) [Lignipirellula cremea]
MFRRFYWTLALSLVFSFVVAGCSNRQPESLAKNGKKDSRTIEKNQADAGKADADQGLSALAFGSRDLNAPVTLNTKIGDPSKKQVLIYYANETAPNEEDADNYEQIIGWLNADNDKDLNELAANLKNDIHTFPAVVDQEIEAIRKGAAGDKVDVVVFTNRLARSGKYYVLPASATEFEESSFETPAFKLPVYNANPLSHRDVFYAALVAVGRRFDPADHDFLLVTKSHGGDHLAMTPRIVVDASKSSREKYLGLVRAKTGKATEGAATPLPKIHVKVGLGADYQGELGADYQGELGVGGGRLGVTKSQYIETLRKVGDEMGMQFPLLFIESCKSQLDGVVLDGLRTPGVNIGRLYTSDLNGLEYQTLDYAEVFGRAADTDTFGDAMHETLFSKYKEQKENREKEKSSFRNDDENLNKQGNVGRNQNDGYTLFAPMASTVTYLIDMTGQVVNSWSSDFKPGLSAYLLPNGDLLRSKQLEDNPSFPFRGGHGGGIQRFNWEGELLWDFDYSDQYTLQHHDIEPLPNGNVLLIAWETKTAEETATAAGAPPEDASGILWADTIVEIQPQGPSGGEIVWKWSVWDHLIQDEDKSRSNYGDVSQHAELVDINFSKRRGRNWTHINGIDYNAELDQICLSVHSFSEIWIIDHSTTTEQAAGHTAGRHGKGGDLLYRWGNPAAHGAGSAEDQQLFGQHNAEWIPEGYPGAGHVLIFNNGKDREEGAYSSVDEIVLPLKNDGSYAQLANGSFGPQQPTWTYREGPEGEFFADIISGAQRLANGNTLICAGVQGAFFEVTAAGERVWQFVYDAPPAKDSTNNKKVFRATRFPANYPAFAVKNIKVALSQP